MLATVDHAIRDRPSASVGGALLGALGALALLRLVSLGLYPLMDKTEARYADIARRMVEANDWVTPWIGNGVPFWGKPPLSFWTTAASLEIFGINEFAARLPHYLLGGLVIWLVWQFARRSSMRAAWHGASLLAGSVLFLVSGGAVMTDMALTLGTTLVMVGFWRCFQTDGHRRADPLLLALGVVIGLLAKGPVSIVLWGLPLAAWALITGNVCAAWQRIAWARIAILAVVVALPWYLLAEARTPGFLHYFIVGEHWQRFTVPGWTGDLYGGAHNAPRGTIWLYAIAAIMPWPLIAPFLRRTRVRGGEDLAAAGERTYLLAWVLAPCLVFTLAANIIWTYVLPGLPALAVLAGYWTSMCQDQARVERCLVVGLAACAVAICALIVLAQSTTYLDSKSAKAVLSEYHAGTSTEPLYFLGHVPFSGSFYSAGTAKSVATVGELPPGRPVYLVLEEEAWKALSKEQLARIQFKAYRGGRVLARID